MNVVKAKQFIRTQLLNERPNWVVILILAQKLIKEGKMDRLTASLPLERWVLKMKKGETQENECMTLIRMCAGFVCPGDLYEFQRTAHNFATSLPKCVYNSSFAYTVCHREHDFCPTPGHCRPYCTHALQITKYNTIIKNNYKTCFPHFFLSLQKTLNTDCAGLISMYVKNEYMRLLGHKLLMYVKVKGEYIQY